MPVYTGRQRLGTQVSQRESISVFFHRAVHLLDTVFTIGAGYDINQLGLFTGICYFQSFVLINYGKSPQHS
jgi:hypothetical protein